MGTLLRTIIWNTSKKLTLSVTSIGMKLFLVLTTVTIIISEIEADCLFKNNTWNRGNNARNGEFLGSNGPFDCNEKCDANVECFAWSLQKGTNYCWLHTVIDFSGSSDAWISGELCLECVLFDNIYIPRGNNVPNGAGLPSNGPFDCNLLCQQYPECVAWTLKKDTNRCWLKTVAEYTGEGDAWISGNR